MPAVLRDLALVVPLGVSAGQVRDALREAAPDIVRDIDLFDVYQGPGQGIEPGHKSLAFRIFMQDTLRTLEDAEVDEIVSGLIRHIEHAVGGRLRT
jgi:phenylalanyl-tRNA synthetase beta chain